MNNRIQTLADQAKESVPQGILAPDLWIQEYNRIFAELIIRECVHSVTRNESFNILERFDMDPKTFFEVKP